MDKTGMPFDHKQPKHIAPKDIKKFYKWTKGEIPHTIYGMSPQCWIDHKLFTEWLLKLFVKNIPQAQPVMLLLNGHSSHYTPEAIKVAAENDIILFACHQMLLMWLNHWMSAFLDL